MKVRLVLFASSILSLLSAGCVGLGEYETDSPTVRLLRGETSPGQFREDVAHTNERQRAREAFEQNRTPTRAYNTRTRRFEFVPEDTVQSWNPETERWEFTPPDRDRDQPAAPPQDQD